MTYEEQFQLAIRTPKVKALIKEMITKWGLNQKKIPNIITFKEAEKIYANELMSLEKEDLPYDEIALYSKHWPQHLFYKGKEVITDLKYRGEFESDLQDVIHKLKFPVRCKFMLYDYLKDRKIKQRYDRVWIRNIQRKYIDNYVGEIILHISPDATLADIKAVWPQVARLKTVLHRGDKKNQRLRKASLVTNVGKAVATNHPIDRLKLREDLWGQEQYSSSDSKQYTKSLKVIERNAKHRFKKKLERFL